MTKLYCLLILLFVFSCSKENKKGKSTNTFYDKAWKYWESKNDDSAFVYFNKAKIIFQNRNDNINTAKCVINMSIIMGNNGDYYGSQEMSLDAIQYLDDKNQEQKEILSSDYNNLGKVTQNLKDYKKAEFFYKEAIRLTNDKNSLLRYNNNLANSYRYQNKYNDAIESYNSLLKIENVKNDIITFPRILDNLAFTKFLQNSNYNAEPELNNALSIREKENDLWGQNASHAHLSDYFYKKDKSKSLFHAEKMLETATELNSPDDKLEAFQKLVTLESPENSKKYFLQYQKLNDSVQTARAKAKNQFALIRYDTEKEKAENASKQNHILKQYVAIGALFLGLLSFGIYYKRQQKIMRQEKEIEVKNTQLKYSRKVHDVVANGLYHTMVEIQNNPEFNKENTLNRIEKMYEESRDIARDDLMELPEKDFAIRLSEMLNSYSSDNQRVLVIGNGQEKWEGISSDMQSEMYYILREAMVNMIKHSNASLTSVKIDKSENKLSIKYTDNGVGIEDFNKIPVSGIQNMENRIAAIGGKITFEKNPQGGLVILITIPTL